MKFTRREFIKGGVAAFTVSFAAPAFLSDLARAQGSSRRNLVVLYLSGSWQIKRMDTQIGKNFDWIVVPNPCGPGACTGLPGGRTGGDARRIVAETP